MKEFISETLKQITDDIKDAQQSVIASVKEFVIGWLLLLAVMSAILLAAWLLGESETTELIIGVLCLLGVLYICEHTR